VHVSANELVVVSALVLCEPLVALAPCHPPDAVQVFAFVVFHVSVEASPLSTLVGAAVRVNVGSGTTVTVTEA
jgi:hypothetical protein